MASTWTIASARAWNGENGRIYGGREDSYGGRSIGEKIESTPGGGYVVALGSPGSLVIRDLGTPDQENWRLEFNHSKDLRYAYTGSTSLHIIANPDDTATVTDDHGTEMSVPLISDMGEMSIVLDEVIGWLSTATSLHQQWDDNPVAFLYEVGFPEQVKNNLQNTIVGVPTAWEQIESWLKTIKFGDVRGMPEEALGSWFSCLYCKIAVAGSIGLILAIVTILRELSIRDPQLDPLVVLEEARPVQEIGRQRGMTPAVIARIIWASAQGMALSEAYSTIADGLCSSECV